MRKVGNLIMGAALKSASIFPAIFLEMIHFIDDMSLITKIKLGIIGSHLIVGFGWLFWKLSPRKGDELKESSDE